MRGSLDLSNVENGFKLLPEGDYDAQIVNKIDKQTRNGDPMVAIMLQIWKDCCEYLIWDNIVLPLPGSTAIKILGRTKNFLHCINEPYDGVINYDSEHWIMKKCKVSIAHEKPNDFHKEVRAIVREYIFDNSLKVESLETEDNPELEIKNHEELPF